MGVDSLPKTVTRQRRDCDLNPGPSAPESSTLTTRLPSWGDHASVIPDFCVDIAVWDPHAGHGRPCKQSIAAHGVDRSYK